MIDNVHSKQSLARGGLVVAALFWGSSPVATRFLSYGQNTWTLLLFRFLPSTLVLAVIYLTLRKLPKFANWDFGRVALISLVGGLGYNGLVSAALIVSPATPVGIALTTEPIWILLLEAMFGSRAFTKNLWVGMLLAFLGTLMATLSTNAPSNRVALGVLLAVLATLSWAIYTVAGSNWRSSSLDKTSFMVLFSTPVAVIASMIVGFGNQISYRSAVVVAILSLSVGSTVVAMTFWNFGTAHLGARLSAPFLYLQPASTIALSMILLHEPIGVLQVLGLLIIVFGLIITQRNQAYKA